MAASNPRLDRQPMGRGGYDLTDTGGNKTGNGPKAPGVRNAGLPPNPPNSPILQQGNPQDHGQELELLEARLLDALLQYIGTGKGDDKDGSEGKRPVT